MQRSPLECVLYTGSVKVGVRFIRGCDLYQSIYGISIIQMYGLAVSVHSSYACYGDYKNMHFYHSKSNGMIFNKPDI